MMNLKNSFFITLMAIFLLTASCKSGAVQQKTTIKETKKEVIAIIDKVNSHWQNNHPDSGNAFLECGGLSYREYGSL